MYDRIDRLDSTVFQHGASNDRVYVLSTVAEDLPQLLPYLENLATKRRYGKVVAKCAAPSVPVFEEWGARIEARIGDYYGEGVDACFVARYFDEQRADERRPDAVAENLAIARGKAGEGPGQRTADWDPVAVAGPGDVEPMSHVYQKVFPSYPFPIFDPAYLEQAMQNDVVFFKLTRDGTIGALASAEMDVAHGAVEMTDFATLPEFRGQGAAQELLQAMEAAMAERGLRTTFTIARAYSTGMNVTFAKCGYDYGGTLVNNTNIAGNIESMNIWWKPLPAAS
ncbi:putative beta-lysine N-acetyltransferase [bacterium]|nr:putative beta-lysine N-acetyltransferase [bacterium]